MNDSKLEILIKPLIKIYEDLELELIKDIAIRLNTYTGVEGSLKWYLDKLQEIGGFNRDNLSLLAEYAGKSQNEVKKILRYAGYDVSNLDKYKEYIEDESLKKNPTQFYESVAIQNLINNAIKETNSIMETIQTKALEGAKSNYMKILTDAYIKVSSGVYSYDQAIKQALKKMAKEGFTGATYKNGKKLSLESTVRRDILTKTHQLSGDIQIENAKKLKTNLVYVTQHLGARIRTKYTKEDYEAHYEWQGKVYMLEGSNDKYDNFYEKTGYGEMLGLCGVNCRHHFYPTFEGQSHQKLFDEAENEKEYIKQQKQRGYERQYRSLRYQKEVAKILDDKEELKKLNPQIREFNEEYNQFLEKNNLQRDYGREYIEKELIKTDNYIDITQNWLENTKAKVGRVIDRKYFVDKNGIKYLVDGKNVVFEPSKIEKDMAKWLKETFGGNVYLNPKVNYPNNVSSPDYLWNNEFWDLKVMSEKATSKTRAVDNIIKKAKKQTDNIILDITNNRLENKLIEKQVQKIYSTKGREWVDKIMIVDNYKLIGIYKRKKRG